MAFTPRNNRSSGAIAEINITPFVDVVLVLLIIFMLTAHVMEYGVQVEVPRTKQVADTSKELPVVNVSNKGDLYLNADPVNINELAKKLEPMLGKDRAAYLRCDKDVSWEIPVQVMAELGRAKVAVSVVTQPLEQTPRRK
jgi:biopolymer transport protein ExbD